MNKLFISTLTNAINHYLHLDPESRDRLAKLRGRPITIELLPFHFIFQCTFNEHGVTIQIDDLVQPETHISGTPLQMMGMMLSKENRHRFFAEDVKITGDAELGQQVVELFDELHIDWEEKLSKMVGDVPAHHAGKFVRKISDWLRHTETTFTQNVNEYLHEEKEWLPSREALQDFFNDIDVLSMDVERTEAKINALRNRLMEEESQ